MTGPADGRRPDSPGKATAPGLVLPASVEAGAGRPAAVPVRITHRGAVPARIRLTVLGVDSSWVPAPLDVGILAPGDTVELTLSLVPAHGTLAARYPFVVAAEATPVSGGGATVMASAESELAVDAAERLSMSISPVAPTAVFGKRIRIDLVNPGSEDREFELVPTSARGIVVRLGQRRVTAVAGSTTSVRGRVAVKRPSVFGGSNVHSYAVRAQGFGAPEFAEATLRSGPVIRGTLAKIVALVSVVALWVGLAVVFIPRISDAFKPDSALSTASQSVQGDGSGSGDDGSGGAGGSGDAGDGTGDAGDGSGAAGGSDGSPGDGGPDGQASGYQLSGTVTGPGAQGTSITLAPMSLASIAERTDNAAPQSSDTTVNALRSMTSGALVKLAGPTARPPAVRASTKTVMTNDKGQFAITGIGTSGYFLLTFAQAGYQTQRFLVAASDLAEAEPMEIELAPGTGSLSGRVVSPAGTGIGAATIVVTDGETTLQTSSISASAGTGTPGAWSVDHLPTPGTYLVTATSPGYGSASMLVELDASGTGTANLTLVPGEGVVTGTVTGVDELGEIGPLGGISVTASDGEVTRTATTVTAAAARGTFILPNLPVPGTYTVVVSADGYLTQTRTVTFGAGASTATVDVALTRADGVIEGRVLGQDADGNDEGGLVGVGLTLSSASVTMKTMTTSGDTAGGYRFAGVPPGTYVLTASQFGRVPASITIELGPSATETADVILMADDGSELPATSHIRGQVVDSRAAGPLTCDRAAVAVDPADCVATITATTLVDPTDKSKGTREISTTTTAALDYVFTLPALDDPDVPGIPPGLYTLTITAPGYATTTTNVQVGQGVMVAISPTSLPVLGLVSGTVSTRIGTPQKPSCVLAIPESVELPAQLPTSCDLDAETATCEFTDLGTFPCALTSTGGAGNPPLGTYQVRGLTAGRYHMLLIAQDPEYRYIVGDPPIVELDLGGDAQFNAVLDRLGHIDVLVLGVDPSTGVPAPVENAPVTITPASELTQTETTTDENGRLTITGLDGIYEIAASSPPGPPMGDDKASNLAVGLNQDVAVTLVLTQPIGAVIGRVVGMVDGTEIPLDGVTVKITGTIGFSGQNPIPLSVSMVTDSDGCYAIVPPEWTVTGGPPLVEGACDLMPSPTPPVTLGPAVGEARFITQNVTVAVDPGAKKVDQPGPMGISIAAGDDAHVGTIQTIQLDASPVPFGSNHKIAAAGPGPGGGGIAAALEDASVVIQAQPALAGGVNIESDAGGTLTFRDVQIPAANMASPGSYQFRVTVPGFAPRTGYLRCPPGLDLSGTACVMSDVSGGTTETALTLNQLPQIAGAITVPYPLPSGVDLDDLTVTATATPAGANQATVALGTAQRVPADVAQPQTAWEIPIIYTDPQYQSLGAGNHLAAPGNYTFRVSLSGYTSQPITVVCGAHYDDASPTGGSSSTVTTGCTQLDATLGALPRFEGSVELQASITMGLGHLNYADANPIVVGRPTITLTIDTDGRLRWKDPNLPLDVMEPGSYTIQISKPGYVSVTTAQFVCDPLDATCGPADPITLKMYPKGAGTVKVADLLPDADNDGTEEDPPWADATVDVLLAPANRNQFEVMLDGSGDTATLKWSDDALSSAYQGIVRTGNYNLRITVPGYVPKETGSFPCTATGTDAECSPGEIDLERKPAFSGTVTTNPTGATDLDDAHFTVTGGPPGAGTVSLSSDDSGALTWVETRGGIAQPANVVTPGNYTVTASLLGYANVTQPFTCSTSLCSLSVVLKQASTLQFVFVSAADGTTPVNGARVTFRGNTFQLDPVTNVYQYGAELDPDGSYTARVQAAGYTFVDLDSDSDSVQCISGSETGNGFEVLPGDMTTCTVKLSPLGVIEGTTFGKQSPTSTDTEALSGVTVTATLLDGADNPTGTVFSATSGSQGALRITGSTTAEGLEAGKWTLTATRSGYQTLTGTVTVKSGFTIDDTVGGSGVLPVFGGKVTLALVPNPVTLNVTMLGESQTPTLPQGTVHIANGDVSSTCTIAADGAGSCDDDSVVVDTGTKHVSFAPLYPGMYTLTVTPSDPAVSQALLYVQVQPGSSAIASENVQSVSVSVSTVASTASGSVVDGSTDPVTDIQGARVYLSKTNTSPAPAPGWSGGQLQAFTTATGEFEFTGVPNGDYYLVIEADGYDRYVATTATTFDAQSNANVKFTEVDLQTFRTKKNVDVTLNLPTGFGPAKEQISLHQVSAPGDAPTTTAAVVADSYSGNVATFNALPTGVWSLVIDAREVAAVPFVLGATSNLTVGPTTTTGSLTVDAAAVTLNVTWTSVECVAAPAGAITATLSNGSEDDPTVELTDDDPPSSKSATVYLPPDSYSWTLSAPAGWAGPTTDPTFIPGTHSSSTINLAAATTDVYLAVTLDGSAVTGTEFSSAMFNATCVNGDDGDYTVAVSASTGSASPELATGTTWSYSLTNYDADEYSCGPDSTGAGTSTNPYTFACTTIVDGGGGGGDGGGAGPGDGPDGFVEGDSESTGGGIDGLGEVDGSTDGTGTGSDTGGTDGTGTGTDGTGTGSDTGGTDGTGTGTDGTETGSDTGGTDGTGTGDSGASDGSGTGTGTGGTGGMGSGTGTGTGDESGSGEGDGSGTGDGAGPVGG